MKKIAIKMLIPALILCASSCDLFSKPTYNEDFIYSEVAYEPLDISYNDYGVIKVDLLGTYKGVKAAAWDEEDIKIRCWYDDGEPRTIRDFDFKVKNIPLDMRHYLGEVGRHTLNIYFLNYNKELDFTIIENPEWNGYKCEFFDREKKYLTTKTVGFYEEVVYDGPAIKTSDEDYDNKYEFTGWNHSTKYVHQDMQYLAKYKTFEKRFYADKIYNRDYIALTGLMESDRKRGSVLLYLGRVRHVAAIHGEAKFLDGEDIEITLDKMDDYAHYWGTMCEDVVKNSVEFVPDSDYESYIYGNPYEIIHSPTFALEFDSRYDYKGISSYLVEEKDVDLSYRSPFESLVRDISGYVHENNKRTIDKNEEDGYYRIAVVTSLDVYVSVSFNRVEEDKYEVGAFNNFVLAPVSDSIKVVTQYSEDGSFGKNFEGKLALTTKGLYYGAIALDWGRWQA